MDFFDASMRPAAPGRGKEMWSMRQTRMLRRKLVACVCAHGNSIFQQRALTALTVENQSRETRASTRLLKTIKACATSSQKAGKGSDS